MEARPVITVVAGDDGWGVHHKQISVDGNTVTRTSRFGGFRSPRECAVPSKLTGSNERLGAGLVEDFQRSQPVGFVELDLRPAVDLAGRGTYTSNQ